MTTLIARPQSTTSRSSRPCRPEFAAALRDSQLEAWRQGTAGMFDHARAVTQP
jgi:hypothetical protein